MNNTSLPINNAFQTFLTTHRKGASLHELSEALGLLVEAIQGQGGSGKLIYTVTIKQTDIAGDNCIVEITDDLDIKKAKPKRPRSIFYTTDDHRLVREDPNQQTLPFHTVEGGSQEVEPNEEQENTP